MHIEFTQTAHTNDNGISTSTIRTIIVLITMGTVQTTVFWAVTLHNVDTYSDVSEKINASTTIFFVVYAVRTTKSHKMGSVEVKIWIP